MPFIRISFVILSIFIGASISISIADAEHLFAYLFIGSLSGLIFSGVLVFFESMINSHCSLKNFNILTLGLFFGILLASAIHILVNSILQNSIFNLTTQTSLFFITGLYLICCYLGIIFTVKTSQEIYASIPFIRFKPIASSKRDILLDNSVLQDPRIIDLASLGLLDNHTVLPRFIVVELQNNSENAEDENFRAKARRSLEVISKLEALPDLQLRYTDADFPEIKDPIARLTRLARYLDSNILTADISRVQQATVEGVRIINIHSLSNALKPLTQTGEFMSIKIQRYGKEPRQGVGYLDDGTMVVVNGGATYIGETIRTQVLSVKHTSSGRMIFCNTTDEDLNYESIAQNYNEGMETPKHFYS